MDVLNLKSVTNFGRSRLVLQSCDLIVAVAIGQLGHKISSQKLIRNFRSHKKFRIFVRYTYPLHLSHYAVTCYTKEALYVNTLKLCLLIIHCLPRL